MGTVQIEYLKRLALLLYVLSEFPFRYAKCNNVARIEVFLPYIDENALDLLVVQHEPAL
jgi:hypothetical protein